MKDGLRGQYFPVNDTVIADMLLQLVQVFMSGACSLLVKMQSQYYKYVSK